jgi:NAD(P)-dependent dehydrogenase (short-subunit alcohol dehydrogenase family)
VAQELEVERFAQKVHERWSAADVLVNNAGISFIARAENISAKDFRRVHGVRVNAVCPAWVKTEMDTADQSPDTLNSDITGRVPMGRFAIPDDIAQAIAFLGDEKQSGYFNGHTLTVDGGWETLRLRHR